MYWIRLKSGVSRQKALDYLEEYDYQGLVSIFTTMEFNRLKMVLSKYHGVDEEEFKNKVSLIFMVLNAVGFIETNNIIS